MRKLRKIRCKVIVRQAQKPRIGRSLAELCAWINDGGVGVDHVLKDSCISLKCAKSKAAIEQGKLIIYLDPKLGPIAMIPPKKGT